MSKFRSIDFWKSSITILPDNSFFELLRTVFGKIKTPFSKQTLISDLEKFLLRSDIQKNIADYIDDNDIRIIAAIAALDEPSPDELESFFSGDLSYAELNDLLINLEERFILYRFNKKKLNHTINHIALNPIFESILSSYIDDKLLLFPSLPADNIPQAKVLQEKPEFLLDDRILAAMLSFVSHNKLFFRISGSSPRGGTAGNIRQKVLRAAESVFSGLPVETVIGALQILGLFIAEGENLVPDYRHFSAFGSLSRQERLIYCAAGIWCYNNVLEDTASHPGEAASPSSWIVRSRAFNYADIINNLYSTLDPQRIYPHATLNKMIFMFQHEKAEPFILNDEKIDNNNIFDIMEKTGLVVSLPPHGLSDSSQSVMWRKVPITEYPASSKKNAVIAMDTSFSILLYPEIAYNDAIIIAAYSTIIEAGLTVRFEMNRDSAVMAFNNDLSADTIINLLRRLSHNRVDENLLFSLRDWEKRHGEVTLRKGLVLTLAPEQRHLAETRSLSRLIAETLAPGIFLLPESAEEKAAEALRKAGVTIIACRKDNFAEDLFSGQLRTIFRPLNTGYGKANAGHHSNLPSGSSASALTDSFHSLLNQMRHGKEERDELAARIDRRLVLCESQLKDAVIRYEKLEARGLDYAGKSLIAKQAISMQTPVEVIWPGKKKQQERLLGIPKAMEKAGSESILIIDPLDSTDTIRLPLGKISVLRRIKKSIFEV